MSLNRHQEHSLRVIEADLYRSDPELGAMLVLFGRLHEGEDVPAREQMPESQHRCGPVHWIAAVLTAMAAVLGRAHADTPAAEPGRISGGGEPGDQHDHSGPAS